METKMARFRVDSSHETGEVMLLIETKCGFRPVMGWPDTNSCQRFAEMLMGICVQINEKSDEVRESSDVLFKQILGDIPEYE
jgi:hypothetical protein